MSRKIKQKFHFSLGVLFRWLFFALIIYFSINYLSGSKSNLNTNIDPEKLNVLGINTELIINSATSQYEIYKKQALDFLDAQFKDIKKQVVNKVYESVIKSIDQ